MSDDIRPSTPDAGLSLIELIVYILVASIVVIASGAILVNSWTTQRNVTTVTEATTRGQAMGSTIERAMRNALDFEVAAGGTELRVRTSLPGKLACQGFNLTTGQSRLSTRSSALPVSAASWTPWQQGVVQNGTTPFFALIGDTVTYTFRIQTNSAPVRISGQASPRSTATGVSAPCW
jgi:Tfp pilus assembly protein PilW